MARPVRRTLLLTGAAEGLGADVAEKEIFVLSGERRTSTGRTAREHGLETPQIAAVDSALGAERHTGRSEVICARCHDRKAMTNSAPKQRSEAAEQILAPGR